MEWKPDISLRRGPRYRVIADRLAEDIAAGLLDPGLRLPARRALADRLGVTVGTVTRAYAEAERRGLVAGQTGRGTFVNPLRGKAPATPDMDTPLLAQVLRPARPQMNLALPAPEFIDFGRLRPAQGPQAQALAQTLQVLGTPANLAGYLADGQCPEEPPLRIAGAKWLDGLGVSVAAEQLFAVAGARQARHAVLAMLGAPSGIILCDPLTHPDLQPIAGLLGMKLHGVMADDDGMLPDSLELACWATGARLLYLMPTLHNPATITIPAQRRRELADIARKYDLSIIEDETCGVLARDRIVSFTSLAGERTFCIAGLDLAVAPGLRAGFVGAPKGYGSALNAAIGAIGAHPAPFLAALAACWIEDGTAARMLDWQREELAARNEIARDWLAGQRLASETMAPHIWLHLPESWDAGDFARRLWARKAVVTPAAKFAADPANAPPAVRIALGAVPDRDSLGAGLNLIIETLALTKALRAV